ncbi:MAG: aminotransferase class III-fold pyridoxal phosphate-dependent enzyme [Chloroflexota bacterium]
MLSKEETKELDKKHVVHGWAVNDQLDPMVVEKSEGVYFWDAEGNKYLDFSSALVNMNVGHQHPKVVEAIKAQADQLCYIHPSMATSARSELGAALAERTPGDLNQFFFSLGGADANENAIKLARLVTGKLKILAKWRSYHGATYGAISASADPRRPPVEPGVPGMIHFLDPFCYRCPFGLEYPSCNLHCAEHVKQTIEMESPDTIAAIIIESQTGGPGFYAPPPGYMERLRELCDEYGILLICDEVMVGFGRTGKWFAIEHAEGVVPDMLTMAKGLTCGYIPLGAVAISDRIMESLDGQFLFIGLTYNAHPVGCAAAVATIGVYKDENLIENSAQLGELLLNRITAMKDKYELIGDARGTGLFACLDLVADRSSKTPLVAEKMAKFGPAFKARGLSTNVIGNRIFIGPPLIITEAQLNEGLDIIEAVLAEIQD